MLSVCFPRADPVEHVSLVTRAQGSLMYVKGYLLFFSAAISAHDAIAVAISTSTLQEVRHMATCMVVRQIVGVGAMHGRL